MDRIPPTLSDPRAEAFGYVCHRCLKCCQHKLIQLNPYEIARLARNRGMTTSEFRSAWTMDGVGLYLAQTKSGTCVFLGGDGCTVHPDRPLVCRLYPLGRQRQR
jgi:Fe-S-cluster containining protein